MKFTVFGSTGFIGSHLATYIESQKLDVFRPGRDEIIDGSVDLGHVIYCIGLTADFREKPFETVEAHVVKLSSILKECLFESFTYVSSTRIYIHNHGEVNEDSPVPISIIDPFDLFNSSKLTGELLTLNCGKRNTRVVRLSNVLGNDFKSKNFITSILKDAICKGEIVLRSTPNSAKDYIGVQDVVSVLFKISQGGRSTVYNVASGVNVTNAQIVNIIQKETGCDVRYLPGAETIIFPRISIQRIEDEFYFKNSREMTVLLEDMISSFKKDRE